MALRGNPWYYLAEEDGELTFEFFDLVLKLLNLGLDRPTRRLVVQGGQLCLSSFEALKVASLLLISPLLEECL